MTYKIVSASLLALAAVQSLSAQDLTARQLWIGKEPDAKPAPRKSALKTDHKKSPKKPDPNAATSTPAPEAALVQNAAYADERPLGIRYALVRYDNGAEPEVSSTATFRSGDRVRLKI